MATAELLLLVLAATVVFGSLARRLKIPDAILLVLAGLGIGFVPGLPHPVLAPDLVFLIVLPPLLHAQAWFTSWREFWRSRRAIFLLAVGLTLFTTVMVALALQWLEPDLPFSICCAFGAIVSPPDAVAASAIAQWFKLPRRLLIVLEGESLVNDATGLVALRFALAAAATGSFSIGEASVRFVAVAGGGIVLGLGIGWLFGRFFRWLRDDSVTIALSLIAPYSAYVAAERLGVSGVLAVVTAGIWLGSRSSELLTANARLKGFGFWSTFVFLLNGAVFLLIGLQLPSVIEAARDAASSRILVDAAVVFAVTVIVRLVWVLPGAYLPRLLSRAAREQEPAPSWRWVAILGWTGMRGVVSLAAAMALPFELRPGVPLPGRDLLIFLTFAVILGTLVVQGLSLPWLIRKLGVGFAGDDGELEEERVVRLAASSAALAHVRTLRGAGRYLAKSVDLVMAEYEDRIRALHRGTASLIGEPSERMRVLGSLQLRREALRIERETLVTRLGPRLVSKEVLIRLERELDLEETRLDGADALERE